MQRNEHIPEMPSFFSFREYDSDQSEGPLSPYSKSAEFREKVAYLGSLKFSAEEGSGLHRQYWVNATIFKNKMFELKSYERITLIQALPRGAYVDVDEARTRWNFNIPAYVAVMIPYNQSIDVELPVMSSQPQRIYYSFAISDTNRSSDSVSFSLLLPIHLRYQAPAYQHQNSFVEVLVSPPAIYVSCIDDNYIPVKLQHFPEDISFFVPTGQIYDRNAVVAITILSAFLGSVLLLWAICRTERRN